MQYHAPSGLYLTKYRAYDPKDGRWLSRDPIEEAGGLNLYAYVRGNPIAYIDPLGLATCTYSISSHTLICTPNSGGGSLTLGPEGVFSGASKSCLNNPACADNKDEGPIPPGKYKMNQDDRVGHEGYWRLEPDPPTPGWKCLLGSRCGFMLHPGTYSLGCITADRKFPATMLQYDQINRLLQKENGANTLTVTQ